MEAATSTPPSFGVGVTAVALFLVLAIALPLAIVTDSRAKSVQLYPVLVLWALCLLTSARLAEFVLRRRAQLVRLAFYVFCYVFIGISGLAQIVFGQFPLSSTQAIPPDTIARAATMFFVGFLAHEVGYLLPGRRASRARSWAVPIPSIKLPVSLNMGVVRLFCVLGVLTSAAAVAIAGIGPFITSREAAGTAMLSDATGPQAYAMQDKALPLLWSRTYHMLPFVGLLLLLHVMRRDATKRTRGYVLLAVVLAGCNVVVNNPLGNSRLWAGIVAFGFLSAVVDLRRPRAVFWTAVVMIVSFFFVFPIADAFRRTVSPGLSAVAGSSSNPLVALTTSGSFSAFQTGVTGLQYVDKNGLTWGVQLIGGLFTLVPHSIWASKPPDTGHLIDPVYNRAATFWTEMHVNFGLVGVILGLLLLGVLARRFDDAFVTGRSWALIVVPLMSPFYFILLRGTLSAAVGTIMPLACLLIAGIWRGRPIGEIAARTPLRRSWPWYRPGTAAAVPRQLPSAG